MNTFSQQLFHSVVPGIFFVLLIMGVLLDVLIVERLEENFDQLLMAKSQGIIALAEFEGDEFMVEQYKRVLPQFVATENAEYFQFFRDDASVVLISTSMPEGVMLATPDTRTSRAYLDIMLPDGRQGRLLRTRFLPRVDIEEIGNDGQGLEMDTVMLNRDRTPVPDSMGEIRLDGRIYTREPLTLYLAISRENLDKLSMQVHALLTSTALLTMLMIAWLAERRIQASVKPLKSVADQVKALNPLQLSQRIHLEKPVVELGVVADQINTLLGKLESTFERERRFSGDVAHELRTPLTELRSMIEVRQRWPNETALSDEFLADASQATLRMQRTVESLLALSRTEGRTTEHAPFYTLPELLQNVVNANRARAAVSAGVSLLVSIADGSIVVQGPGEWQVIVKNLLDNAIEYSEANSTIFAALQFDADKATVTLSITNTVNDLEQADVPHMFERLWRKDKSRTSGSHSGLGLSLVKACSHRIGATIESELACKELTISIRCSLAPPHVENSDAVTDLKPQAAT